MKKGGEILRHFSGTCGGSFPFPNCQGPFLPFRISGKARCKHSHDRYQQQAAAQSQYYQHCFSELSICLDGSVYPVRKDQKEKSRNQKPPVYLHVICLLPNPPNGSCPSGKPAFFILSDHLIRIKAAWRRRKRLRHHQLSRKETAGGLKNPGLTISIFDDIVVSKQ